jgi:hypothetical protein
MMSECFQPVGVGEAEPVVAREREQALGVHERPAAEHPQHPRARSAARRQELARLFGGREIKPLRRFHGYAAG